MTKVRHGWSLRWLIGGIYFGIMASILGGLALYFSYRVEVELVSRSLNIMRGNARQGADKLTVPVEQFAHSASPAQRTAAAKEILRSMSRIYLSTNGGRVALLTRDGKVADLGEGRVAEIPFTTRPQPSSRFDPEVRDALSQNDLGENIRANPTANGETTFFVAVPVLIREQVPIPKDQVYATPVRYHLIARYILLLAVPLTIQETVTSMKTAIGLAFLAALLVVFVINTYVSNTIAHPLATLGAAAQRIADGKLDERVQPAGAIELASLGDAFNQMADQLRLTISTLANERAQAEAILASMADAVIVTDTDGHLLLFNNTAETLLGLQADATIGKTLSEALLPFELEALLEKTLSTRTPLRHDVTITHPTERFVEAHMAPVNVDEQIVGVVIVLYDMTNERRVAQIHRDFVANVSHELRTPVTSIRALAETLLDGGLEEPEMARDFLATVTAESERLTTLLDDLLHLAQMESGRRHLALETVTLAEVIDHVTERLVAPITAKGQRLVRDVPAALTATVDRDAFTQIVLNLMDNARKYSPEGATITVHASRDASHIYLRVTDTGFGIPREEQERIFERFYRVDKARARAQGGTGLGLSIVKHLVELHAGRITVESEQGVGSIFTVVLPQSAGTTHPEDAGERASGTVPPTGRQ